MIWAERSYGHVGVPNRVQEAIKRNVSLLLAVIVELILGGDVVPRIVRLRMASGMVTRHIRWVYLLEGMGGKTITSGKTTGS
ncbi:hypothetical protein PR048_015630 [Dryococelus australis]|uniref:Uncharacterized protein n=1 Tax=Dryococelus australis TaxID=614101 RepID=A0ABQ9HI07_9NEOP|nr:hypothetical protein PR048_015630 [Dryococelus australis]